MGFLPVNQEEMKARGWDCCDVVLVTGDAYVDHPSFGTAVIGRVLESKGYRVGVIAQPDWRTPADIGRLGKPRLFFGVTSGNIDSMLHHYTANKKLRHNDPYSPGGRHGLRPNRAAIVYSNLIRQAYKDVPIVLGGIEASLRRLAHYDYWDDAVRRSILIDAKADMLVYGMGESAVSVISELLNSGNRITDNELRGIPGTAAILKAPEAGKLRGADVLEVPSFEDVSTSKEKFNRAFVMAANEANPYSGKKLLQQHGDRYLLVNPPAQPLNQDELDAIYELPYQMAAHPQYQQPVPALETVKWSLVSHRGCYGGCSFCTLHFHQGPVIQSRSHRSLVRQAKQMALSKGFRGVISDVGGPTANMYGTGCKSDGRRKNCRRASCLSPDICSNLNTGQSSSTGLLRELAKIPQVKSVFVASGVRHDLALRDQDYLKELVTRHTGGHLKVAPEHCSFHVLKQMNKPSIKAFEEFLTLFRRLSKREQYLVPYLISSHPGCSLDDMMQLKRFLKRHGLAVEQVQDFIPLPMTASAAMYHTGINPYTGEELFVERTAAGKLKQRYLLSSDKREEWEESETLQSRNPKREGNYA
jgi:uncharacterized radical SAM protein YgiQ